MLFSTILLFASQILSTPLPTIEREHQFLSSKRQPLPVSAQSQQEELVDHVAAALKARREKTNDAIQKGSSMDRFSNPVPVANDLEPAMAPVLERSDHLIPGTLVVSGTKQEAEKGASALGLQVENTRMIPRLQRSDARIPGTLITTTKEQAADPRVVSFWQEMARKSGGGNGGGVQLEGARPVLQRSDHLIPNTLITGTKEQAQAGAAALGLDVGRGIETTGIAAKASSILSRLRFW